MISNRLRTIADTVKASLKSIISQRESYDLYEYVRVESISIKSETRGGFLNDISLKGEDMEFFRSKDKEGNELIVISLNAPKSGAKELPFKEDAKT